LGGPERQIITMSKLHQKTTDTGTRATKLALSLIFYSGNRLWRRLQELAGKEPSGTCVVLYYHAVPAEHRARFARQMNVLMRHAKPVKSETKEPLENGVHHVAVVFHDAFVSVCDNALPELAQRKIPSTLFVPSGYLGQRQGWITDKAHADYGETVVDAIRLKSFDTDLVAVGSHTVTHADLSLLTEAAARSELERSKMDLEAVLERPVRLFAFPYGRSSDALTGLSRKTGYQRVFTIQPELAFSTPDEYVTGSCSVSPTDWDLEFKLKLLGAYHWLPRIYTLRNKARLILNKWGAGLKKNGLPTNAPTSPTPSGPGERKFKDSPDHPGPDQESSADHTTKGFESLNDVRNGRKSNVL
jgi:peptidoglycan/xylan/chitin deacetylase (PgdA/CDA1 family)